MPFKKPERQWQQDLIDAYYDYKSHEVLDPLYEQFQRWNAGELTHEDMNQAIHEAHKQNQKLYVFFSNSLNHLVNMIQWDRDWFTAWVADHPPPPGVELLPVLEHTSIEVDDQQNS